MGKLDIPYTQIPVTMHNNEIWHHWCCDCGLRHTQCFKIIRGKTPDEDRVEIIIDRDNWATLAAKTIDRLKKRLKTLKGK